MDLMMVRLDTAHMQMSKIDSWFRYGVLFLFFLLTSMTWNYSVFWYKRGRDLMYFVAYCKMNHKSRFLGTSNRIHNCQTVILSAPGATVFQQLTTRRFILYLYTRKSECNGSFFFTPKHIRRKKTRRRDIIREVSDTRGLIGFNLTWFANGLVGMLIAFCTGVEYTNCATKCRVKWMAIEDCLFRNSGFLFVRLAYWLGAYLYLRVETIAWLMDI